VVEDQRGYYLLGYEPEKASFETGRHGALYHRVSIRVKRPGLQVRSRAGYYGVTDREVSKPPAIDALMRALETPLVPGQMGLRVTALPDADDARRPFVRVLLHVDGATVTLAGREASTTAAPSSPARRRPSRPPPQGPASPSQSAAACSCHPAWSRGATSSRSSCVTSPRRERRHARRDRSTSELR
jgi:hypothetical protein